MTRVTLGDAARFINGAAFRPEDWGSEGLPIIRIQNLTGTGEHFNYTTRKVKDELVVKEGDLLVSWSATLDVYRWSGPRGLLNQHIFKVLPKLGVDPGYLYFALKSVITELESKTHGSTMKHVVRGDFENTRIHLPDIKEQRCIVDLLSRAEGIVRLRREAQRKAAELIPAIFIDMFGDPVTNPKGWPVAKLGELLSSIDSGHSPKCSDRHRGVDEWGVLRLGAVSRCEYDEHQHKTLPRDIVPDSSIEVKSGDLLLSRKNTAELVGASAYVWATGGRVLLPDLIFRLQLVEAAPVNAIYLWKLLTTDAKRSALTRLATGSAGSMPNISKERLRTLPVEVPSPELQMKFADLVKEVRSIGQQQQAAIEKAEAVFASLLADAFLGA
jgi:type I restriction enzyme S subunit